MIGKSLNLLIKNPFRLFRIVQCRLLSYKLSKKIDEGTGQISIGYPPINVKIIKSNGAKLIVNGTFKISPHLGGTAPVRIYIRTNATLHIDGDFTIGQGIRMHIGNNAELYFGGRKEESDSGITSDTLIMVRKKVHIGKDFICAWNVFISDSDWHTIEGQNHQADVVIGDHVWIANSCSILKGSVIGNNCIVASHSKVTNKINMNNVLLAGNPAKIVRTDVKWKRDI